MEHKIWNPKWECATREEKNQIQLERLKKITAYCYERVPFYKKKFDEIGLKPDHIKTLKDVRLLPFTTASDLKDNYPFGLFAVPKDEIVRIHGSSGTTGKPKIVGYTRNDLENWTECLARLITAAGVTSKDITQIAFGYGLFTGGFGLHYRNGKSRSYGSSPFLRKYRKTNNDNAGFRHYGAGSDSFICASFG